MVGDEEEAQVAEIVPSRAHTAAIIQKAMSTKAMMKAERVNTHTCIDEVDPFLLPAESTEEPVEELPGVLKWLPKETTSEYEASEANASPKNMDFSLQASKSLQDSVNKIVEEYRQKLDELMQLTAELPKRLQLTAANHSAVAESSPSKSNASSVDHGQNSVMAERADIRATYESNASSADRGHSARRTSFESATGRRSDITSEGATRVTTKSETMLRLQDPTSSQSTFQSQTRLTAITISGDSSPGDKKSVVTVNSKTSLEVEDLIGTSFSVKKQWGCAGHMDGTRTEQIDIAERSQKAVSINASESHTQMQEFNSQVVVQAGWFAFLIGSPFDTKRVTWEMVGFVLVLYDLISIPLIYSFEPPTNGFTEGIDMVELLYWTMNVPIFCTTAFVEDGTLVMNPLSIFCRYAKTWMMVDCLTVLPDWFFTLSTWVTGGSGDSGSSLKVLRIIRLLRLARLLRLVKLRNAWNMICDMIDSEKIGIVMEVTKMVLLLMVVNHFISCVWFVIGNAQPGPSWINNGFSRPETDWGHQYVVAYHWSITQFTPASMDVQPRSAGERVFAIYCVVFGVVGFSYLVGSITGSLARLRIMAEKKTNSFWLLRRFLRRSRVPQELSMRIKSYVETVWSSHQQQSAGGTLEVLGLLSDQLKAELDCAMHSPTLVIHPLFEQLEVFSTLTIRRLTHTGISMTSLAPLDMMFVAGEEATHMSFVTKGTMEYHRIAQDSDEQEIVESNEDWIAEPVLWIDDWVHLGDLRAASETELLRIDPASLLKIVGLNPVAFKVVSFYARGYVTWLNEFDKLNLSDISQGENVTEDLNNLLEYPLQKHNRRNRSAKTSTKGLFAKPGEGRGSMFSRIRGSMPASKNKE